MPQSCAEDDEARLLGRYLLGHLPSDRALDLYIQASSSFGALNGASRRLLSLAYRYPWLLGALDSGLALTCKSSPLRFRIWAMSAILETCPEYFSHFSPTKGLWATFSVFGTVLRAPLRALIGIIVVAVNK